MTQLDDGILVAYVDGELDAETAREVEAALAQDPKLTARVRILRETADLVRAALEEPADESLSPRLRKALERVKSPARTRRRWRFVLPLAASLAGVAIGLGGGYFSGIFRIDARNEQLNGTHWVAEIVAYYKVFAQDKNRFVELGDDQVRYIKTWLGERLGRELQVPDLSRYGLAFLGGRLIAVEGQAVGLLAYKLPDGRRIGVCVTSSWLRRDQALTAGREDGLNLVHWARSGYAYVLLGPVDEKLLWTIAPDIAGQLEAT